MAEHNISYTGWLGGVQPIRATLGGKRDRTVLSQWELIFWEWPLFWASAEGDVPIMCTVTVVWSVRAAKLHLAQLALGWVNNETECAVGINVG